MFGILTCYYCELDRKSSAQLDDSKKLSSLRYTQDTPIICVIFFVYMYIYYNFFIITTTCTPGRISALYTIHANVNGVPSCLHI